MDDVIRRLSKVLAVLISRRLGRPLELVVKGFIRIDHQFVGRVMRIKLAVRASGGTQNTRLASVLLTSIIGLLVDELATFTGERDAVLILIVHALVIVSGLDVDHSRLS